MASIHVAPFAGAWIEICMSWITMSMDTVAPFAGAWIEIARIYTRRRMRRSLPSRERGLKSHMLIDIDKFKKRRSLRGSVD